MSISKEYKSWIANIIFFNKFLYALIAFNLIVYTLQIDFTSNIITNAFILILWVMLFLNVIINETSRQLCIKYENKKIDFIRFLTRTNIISSFFLIFCISFLTGNTDFLYLNSIPIIYCLLSSFKRQTIVFFLFSCILFVWADYSGWLNNSFLIVNQNINIPPVLTYVTIFSLIILLGFMFTNYVNTTTRRTKKLYTLATRDALTGLINKRELNRRLIEEMSRAKRHKSPLTIALFDLDYFKKINDKFGHVAGDFVLKELGKLIRESTRSSDIAARYGGEEFALILPETAEQEAFDLLERIRQKVENKPFYYSYIPIKATLSVGVAQFELSDTSPEIFCQRVDKLLYKAKNNGRNRVECSSGYMSLSDFKNIVSF